MNCDNRDMIEKRLKEVEEAIVRLTVAVDKMTEAYMTAVRHRVIPVQDGRPNAKKPRKPNRITKERIIEVAARYERVKSKKDFDILLSVFDIQTLADLEKKDYQAFYNQMLRELHIEFEHPGE